MALYKQFFGNLVCKHSGQNGRKAERWGPFPFSKNCSEFSPNFSRSSRALFWSVANGGLRDGGLSKSEDIGGKKAFFLRFLDFPGALRTLPEKGEKGRKRAKKADFG